MLFVISFFSVFPLIFFCLIFAHFLRLKGSKHAYTILTLPSYYILILLSVLAAISLIDPLIEIGRS